MGITRVRGDVWGFLEDSHTCDGGSGCGRTVSILSYTHTCKLTPHGGRESLRY